MQRRRVIKRVSFVLIGIVVAVLLAFAGLVGYFVLLGQQSVWGQEDRMSALRAAPDAASAAESAAEWSLAADHTLDGGLSFDQLRVVATHNSYALEPTWLQRSVIDLVEPGEGPLLRYEHAPLWDQLDAGIRSFELDIRWNGTDFSMSHVPLVANRTTSPDLALALEEIKIWSDRHPGHLPLSIMIEPKSDYMFLDPTLAEFDAAAWDAFDTLLIESLGENLFTPDDLREATQTAGTSAGSGASLRSIVSTSGWPQLDNMRDSVLFFLSDNEDVREQYLAGHVGLEGRSMFTSSQTPADDVVFAVRDDPAASEIAADVSVGVIVRTRADADLDYSEARARAALDSGAQIISTDFPPSEPQPDTGYFFVFTGGSLIQAGVS